MCSNLCNASCNSLESRSAFAYAVTKLSMVGIESGYSIGKKKYIFLETHNKEYEYKSTYLSLYQTIE